MITWSDESKSGSTIDSDKITVTGFVKGGLITQDKKFDFSHKNQISLPRSTRVK